MDAQEGPGSVKAGGRPGADLGRADSGRGIAKPDWTTLKESGKCEGKTTEGRQLC